MAIGISTSLNGVDNIRFVAYKSDFPTPSGGVITLEDNKTYFISGTVDLTGDRIVAGQNTALQGGSSENTFLISTGLDANTALITSEWSITCRFISFTHGTAVNLDADGNPNQALDWFQVNFTNCANSGTIANYSNAVFNTCAILNSSNLTFDGTIGSIVYSDSLIQPASGGAGLILPSTLTLTRRLRVTDCAVVVIPGSIGLDVDVSASIEVEGYILDTVNFSAGGTYVSGVQFDDNKSNWSNCRGVINSANIAHMTMTGNATATTISATSTPVKVAGTTVAQPITQRFTHTANRLTSDGAIVRAYKVTAILSFTSGTNNEIGAYVALNGTVIDNSETYATANASGRAENTAVQTITELTETDYIEIFVENNSIVSDITVSDMNVVVEALN